MKSMLGITLGSSVAFALFCCIPVTSSYDLEARLFNASRYDRRVIPKQDDEPLSLYVGLSVLQIENLDEKQQMIVSHIILTLQWYDNHLTWNPADYGGTDVIVTAASTVWVPDIVLYNSVKSNGPSGMWRNKVKLKHNGWLQYDIQRIVYSSCRTNVENYPFDRQTCELKYGSWAHHGLDIEIRVKNGTKDLPHYVKNGKWELEEVGAERNAVVYGCCPEPYYDITYVFKLRRQVLYYAMYYIVPCALIALLAATIFVLPQDCSERITVGMCSLVGLSFFFLLVSENMPASANLPLIGGYYSVTMIQMAVSFFMNILVLRFHNMTDDEVPNWVRKFILGYAAAFLRKKFRYSSSVVELSKGFGPADKVIKKECTELEKTDKVIVDAITEEQEGTMRDIEWKQAAHILNNCALILHIVVVILTFAAMFFEVVFITRS